MRKVIHGALATLALLVAAACSPTEPGLDAVAFAAAVEGPVLRLTNTGNRTAYYFAVERERATLIDWVPCSDPDTCVGVAPNTSVEVPYSAIHGYAEGAREAIVYWWHILPQRGGGTRASELRSVIVSL